MTRRAPATVAICVLLSLYLFNETAGREWTDTTGKYTVEAELVSFKDGTVRLKKQDGSVISLSLEKLSARDREYLTKQTRSVGGGPGARSIVREQAVGQKWALLIGVNDYAEINDLEYCGRDVETLRDTLVAAGFPARNVFSLHDEANEAKYRPSKLNIERQLEGLLSLMAKNDVVVVAFSGHGVHLDGTSYLCPMEASLKAPERTLLSLEYIYEQLLKSKARQKLLLVDACRNDPRPAGEKSATSGPGTDAFARALEKPPQGILVLTSCQPGEVSVEDPAFNHGVFMHFFIEGLTGLADREEGGNQDERVSLLELYKFAHNRTKAYVFRKRNLVQTPMLRGQIAGDYEIAVVKPLAVPAVHVPATTASPSTSTPSAPVQSSTSHTRATLALSMTDLTGVWRTENGSYYALAEGGKDKVYVTLLQSPV
ncbi:MAG: caspase family protein, partial [Planctomycetes bacterium]|nr:caspase family protein [Planctomycetota bacterium]